MKRIAFLVCGMLLLISNTAEARRYRYTSGGNYTQPAQVAPASYTAPAATSTQATAVSYSSPAATSTQATTASYSTSTAQGVANLMASYNRVGHFGGNPG